jgi:hypothetical protein
VPMWRCHSVTCVLTKPLGALTWPAPRLLADLAFISHHLAVLKLIAFARAGNNIFSRVPNGARFVAPVSAIMRLMAALPRT